MAKIKDHVRYPTYLRTAEVAATKTFHQVAAQNALCKEDVTHLLLYFGNGEYRWFPITELSPCL